MNVPSAIIYDILKTGKRVCIDTDEEDDEYHIQKVKNFAEEIVPTFRHGQFKQHFRLAPETFEDLLHKISSVTQNNVHSGQPKLPFDTEVMICIWYIANCASFRTTAQLFNVTKSTRWDVVYRTSTNLLLVNSVFGIIK